MRQCFNPLLIGAWSLTMGLNISGTSRLSAFVSIPFSSGHGLSHAQTVWSISDGRTDGFNPLLIGAWSLTRTSTSDADTWATISFNPLLIGAWSLTLRHDVADVIGSDTVSIPFSSGHGLSRLDTVDADRAHAIARFNPLLIGAWSLTIGLPKSHAMATDRVSIPFSSGHGLSPGCNIGCIRRSGRPCFNPLLIGAWSLTARNSARPARCMHAAFQSPSHRGMVSHGDRLHDGTRSDRSRFNPLLIGAWSLTSYATFAVMPAAVRFQSPSHRGMVSHLDGINCRTTSSIRFNPLLIGAWSLTHCIYSCQLIATSACFNPLLIGAWSLTGTQYRWRVRAASSCFNPLLIGAWSLTCSMLSHATEAMSWFQSPSHRGMVSHGQQSASVTLEALMFQSPSHRGMVSHPCIIGSRRRRRQTRFNPLLIGAWSLTWNRTVGSRAPCEFQSPSHRGMVSHPSFDVRRRRGYHRVSIPFSSGHGLSRTHRLHAGSALPESFNPLLIGAWSLTLPKIDPVGSTT